MCQKADNEQKKLFAKDYCFPFKDVKLGKKYGNCCLIWSLEDVELLSTVEKKAQKRFLLEHSQGTSKDNEQLKKLAKLFPTNKQQLLIREATCKFNPFASHTPASLAPLLYYCPMEDCLRMKPYKYQSKFKYLMNL